MIDRKQDISVEIFILLEHLKLKLKCIYNLLKVRHHAKEIDAICLFLKQA